MLNHPSYELIPEFSDVQLPSRTYLFICFDEPLMTSETGPLLLTEHAVRSGNIA